MPAATADDYWRSRAGVPAVNGVLASQPGQPGLAPLPAVADRQAREGAPVRLSRLAVAPEVAELVRHVWIPRWSLPPGVVVEQGVLEYPSANLVIEAGGAALHGPELGRGHRRLEGTGWAFGALLQPGVARLLVTGPMRAPIGGSVAIEELRATDAAALVDAIRTSVVAGDDEAARSAFESWMLAQHLVLDDDSRLVRRVVELAETDRTILRAEDLASASGLGLRSLQRLVREQLGLTPKWLIRRYRMQEAAAALAAPDALALADLAASLGFVDQAHLTREFRAVIGETPRRYAEAATAAR
ncbi:AraC family transcriptional regulator [Agromyces albus]|uniref:AraC family transcriptional regulator n=1 Tax=Agromyces albus TaxID=205332 RepID=A0A4Q2L751_9MICO|nr:helix-turn-helix domain-containing protein [Agromyces albus]RXZ72282.1 AraC family transcriptional regulator [Agromyces albus]